MQKCILSYNNRAEVLELPVPLQSHETTSGNNTYNFTTIERGDIKAIGGSKLKTMQIDSFFPNHQYPFLMTKMFPKPWDAYNTIENWRISSRPIRVIIVGTNINLAMSIEEFKVTKEDKDGSGDLYFSLSLEEYRFANTESYNSGKNVNSFTGLRTRV